MSASFSATGLVPMSLAIAGSEVAITVESMFSMNRATARMSGMVRFKRVSGRLFGAGGERGLRRAVSMKSLACLGHYVAGRWHSREKPAFQAGRRRHDCVRGGSRQAGKPHGALPATSSA